MRNRTMMAGLLTIFLGEDNVSAAAFCAAQTASIGQALAIAASSGEADTNRSDSYAPNTGPIALSCSTDKAYALQVEGATRSVAEFAPTRRVTT